MTITLYDVQPSPHARKVRLLAAELGIKLTKVACDPRIGETRTAEYLAKNPNGRVPTLEDDGFVLRESPAILKYLAAKRPDRALGGSDPKAQALVDHGSANGSAVPRPPSTRSPGSFSSSPRFSTSPATTPASSPTRMRGLTAFSRCSTSS